jgi:hypothetical protein
MDERNDLGVRILGVVVGIGASLPVGLFALMAIQLHSRDASVVLGGITLALIIATVAVADGQAWGALVIAIYGAGMALVSGFAIRGEPYANNSETTFVALHVAVAVLALTVAYGLARGPTSARESP